MLNLNWDRNSLITSDHIFVVNVLGTGFVCNKICRTSKGREKLELSALDLKSAKEEVESRYLSNLTEKDELHYDKRLIRANNEHRGILSGCLGI